MTPFLNYIFALVLFIGLGAFMWFQYGGYVFEWFQSSGEMAQVYIAGNPLKVTVADTPEQRKIGLSGTLKLEPYTGKLFVFDEPKKYGIWMKDMNFPLDILWFDESLRLIYVKEEVQPETYPNVFSPNDPALYVVELPSGTVDDLQIKLGSKLELPPYLLP